MNLYDFLYTKIIIVTLILITAQNNPLKVITDNTNFHHRKNIDEDVYGVSTTFFFVLEFVHDKTIKHANLHLSNEGINGRSSKKTARITLERFYPFNESMMCKETPFTLNLALVRQYNDMVFVSFPEF